jgi:hypothetical protein
MSRLSGNLRVQRAIPIEQWPVLWRVVAPRCGDHDSDITFIETEDEAAARRYFHASRCADYPVRLERVQCGPLPANARVMLKRWRDAAVQSAGTHLREVPAHWEVGSHG